MDELKEKIEKFSKEWKAVERDTEEKRKTAEEFYRDKLMPLVKEYFLKNNKENVKCECLILTLGTSYEPLVLSISALRPKKVLIMYTEQTQHFLDDVIEFTNLKPSQYQTALIGSENPLTLYKKVKDIYIEWNRPKNICVDFTGGTKCMAASCAMAGSAIGAKLIYIGNDKYLGDLKKPDPGTEKLFVVDDPFEVFGDLERDEAISLFNKMNFNSAYRIFSKLENKVPGSNKEYTALRYISRAYDSWDSLNLKQADSDMHKCLDIINNEARVEKNFILSKHKETIKEQADAIAKLYNIHANGNKKEIFKNIEYIIANFYENAMRREKQGKYEMASLLLYRILEMIEQKRLWNYDSFDTSNADYEKLKCDKDMLFKVMNVFVDKIGNKQIYKLDKEISLMNGYIILATIEDEFFTDKDENEKVQELIELRDKVHVRNKGSFAHGFEFIDESKYKTFKKMVDRYISIFYRIEKIDKDKIFKPMKFIELK